MQVILGANGIIGEGIARELHNNYAGKIKIVGRSPEKINAGDMLFAGDLLKPANVNDALKGAEIAYLTVGLPYNSEIWLRDWPIIMQNVVEGCITNNCKLVYFDNTYAYPQDSEVQTEDTPLKPTGKKGLAKKAAAEIILAAINSNKIEAVICRAPEFYGPGKTQGLTNTLIFEKLKQGKKPKILISDEVVRTLIFTPDASRSTALIGNSPDAFGQTWHLPCDDNRLTYKEIMDEISTQLGREIDYDVLGSAVLKFASLVNTTLRETQELLPRYKIDNIFDSAKFKQRFPDFEVTKYPQGIKTIIEDYGIK